MGIAHRDKTSLSFYIYIYALHKLLLYVKFWFQHIDSNAMHYAVLLMQQQRLYARQRLEAYLLLCCQSTLKEILPDATARIAAHHSLRTVGIEDAHGEVGIRNSAVIYQHKSIAADTLVAVAPFDSGSRRVGNRMARHINVDVVIATAVHLAKRDFSHSFYVITLLRHIVISKENGERQRPSLCRWPLHVPRDWHRWRCRHRRRRFRDIPDVPVSGSP